MHHKLPSKPFDKLTVFARAEVGFWIPLKSTVEQSYTARWQTLDSFCAVLGNATVSH